MKNRQEPEPGKLRQDWPESSSRPMVSPLQLSAAYSSSDPDALDALYEGKDHGYTYAREGHPNADVLAGMIDDLEGQPGGVITSSGMAAVLAALMVSLKSGDHVIGSDQLYGRTLRLFSDELHRMGVDYSLVDATDATNVSQAIRPQTKAILLEVISNPTLRIADVTEIAKIARGNDLVLIIDNTFTTPFGFDPWMAGADIVVHSVTKLLAGHSDVTLGYVAARDPQTRERLGVLVGTFGLTPSGFDCWLAERGLLTFGLRFRQATQNAAALADALVGADGIAQVIYPGHEDHIDADRAGILKSPCNMVSLRLDGGRQEAVRFTRGASRLAFAPTLGDVSTTISHPASSSHRALDEERRSSLGIDEGFFRLSVGIEDIGFIKDCIFSGIASALGR